MDLHQLRTFVAVARLGSVARAAETLHASQPAISAHVKAVEESLGLVLFVRTGRGMRLTDEGARVLGKAEGALEAQRELHAEAARAKGRQGGVLRLGASPSVDPVAVSAIVARLAERLPSCELSLDHERTGEIVLAVRSGRLDAGIVHVAGNGIDDPELASVELSAVTMCLVGPRGGATPAAASGVDRIASHAWIGPGTDSAEGLVAESMFVRHGVRPARHVRVDRAAVARDLVARGVGLSVLPEDLARADDGLDVLGALRGKVRVVLLRRTRRVAEEVQRAIAEIAADAYRPRAARVRRARVSARGRP